MAEKKSTVDKVKQFQLLSLGALISLGFQILIQGLNRLYPLSLESTFIYSGILFAAVVGLWWAYSQKWPDDYRMLKDNIDKVNGEIQTLKTSVKGVGSETGTARRDIEWLINELYGPRGDDNP